MKNRTGRLRLRLILFIVILIAVFWHRFAIEIQKYMIEGKMLVKKVIQQNRERKNADVQGPQETEHKESVDIVRITLKNNREITGIIQREIGLQFEVDIGIGTVKIAKENIARLEALTDSEKKDVMKIWKRDEDYDKAGDIAVIKYKDKDRITVPVTINGKTDVELILDTGAPYVVLIPEKGNQFLDKNSRIAKKINMKWTDGSTTVGRKVLLHSVKIGNVEVKNVIAVVCEIPILDRGTEGLLGMSCLEKFNIRIEPSNKRMLLEKR